MIIEEYPKTQSPLVVVDEVLGHLFDRYDTGGLQFCTSILGNVKTDSEIGNFSVCIGKSFLLTTCKFDTENDSIRNKCIVLIPYPTLLCYACTVPVGCHTILQSEFYACF